MAGRVNKSTGKKTATSKRSVHVRAASGAGAQKARRSQSAAAAITETQVRERAFQIYLARSGGPGDACSDWYQAERELRDALRS